MTSNSKEYYYCCSQDSSNIQDSKKVGKRDRDSMKRFPCDSRLSIKPDFNNRKLSISLHHKYHIPYVSIQLSQAALEFIASRSLDQTLSEIYRDLQASDIPDVENIAQHQVYYQWHRANSNLWRNDNDAFVSATKFLEGLGSNYQYEIYSSGNLRALAMYIHGTISGLVTKSKELVIDATYGTNNAGKDMKISIENSLK